MDGKQGKMLGELAEEVIEQYVSVSVVGDHIVFSGDNLEYELGINECNTYPNLIYWMCHLSSKSWMNSSLLREFVRVAAKENNLAIRNDL